MNFLFAFVSTFIVCWIAVPILLVFLAAINFYTTVMEGRAKVYVLFGRVLGVVSEPGLHLLWLRLGPQAALVRFFGQVHEIDTRLDQEYLRSNRSIPKRARQWVSGYGTKCGSSIPWIICLRISILAAHCEPTLLTPRYET